MKKVLAIALIIVVSLLIISINGYERLDNNLLSVYLDNEEVTGIPSKGYGTYLKSVCDDNVDVSWDNDNWGLFISGLSKKVKCNVYFSSDVEKPSWQIDRVSSNNVLTTDIYTIRLVGSDNSKVSSSLSVNDIKFLVSNCDYEPISKSLEVIESSDKKIIYELKVYMLKGEGKLVLRINNGTLKDDSGNENDSTDLDTGIIITKNNDTKILVWQDWGSRAKSYLKDYYENLKIDTDMSISSSDVIKDNYDVVVYNYPYWGASTKLNEIYNSGINLLSQYNNYTSDLTINDDSKNTIFEGNSADIFSANSNFLNGLLGDSFQEYDGGKVWYWHFNSKATILYKTVYNDEAFDKIGYLKENDNMWFNIGVNNSINYVPIIEFIMGRIEE